ncbi:MAG: hypothetical protein QXP55_00365 [Nitrososphaerales archaeon]
MKINSTNLIISFGILFLITGIIWVFFAIFNEGTILLLESGIANLITGALLLTKFGGRYIRALVIASGLYNFIICSYQLYAASNLLRMGLTIFTVTSLIGYTLGSLAFLFVTIIAYMNSQAFVPSNSQTEDKSKDR